jgi:DNA-binding MarR family transcriptional regulator
MHPEPDSPVPHGNLLAVVFPLVEAIRKMLARVELIWSDDAVTPSEAAVLERIFISYNGRARSGALLGHPIRSTRALRKVLGSLEEKGFIARNRDEDDGRVVIVSGTEKGRELYDVVIERIPSEVVGPTMTNVDVGDFATLRRITAAMRPPEPRRT